MTWSPSGRTVLITGAARGIGAEAARQLRARGANLALAGLEPELLEQRAAELGGDTAWFECDVCDPDALDAAVAGAVERFGGIDVVIANAGVAPHGTVASIDPAAFEKTIEVNLLGVWRTVRAALPHVVERRGYVLPIASLAAALHTPLMAAYTASKAGVEAFADALRGEVAHTGTAVGCAYFSFIDTDMVRRGLDRPSAMLGTERLGERFTRRATVQTAGAAIARGVERRSRHVVAPRWVLPALYARTLLQPLAEANSRRSGLEDVIRLAEQEPSDLTTAQPDPASRVQPSPRAALAGTPHRRD
jgi:NAD(P)-dependent dehydrogenase (short-subunit alcohol dehydrogenase family)